MDSKFLNSHLQLRIKTTLRGEVTATVSDTYTHTFRQIVFSLPAKTIDKMVKERKRKYPLRFVRIVSNGSIIASDQVLLIFIVEYEDGSLVQINCRWSACSLSMEERGL